MWSSCQYILYEMKRLCIRVWISNLFMHVNRSTLIVLVVLVRGKDNKKLIDCYIIEVPGLRFTTTLALTDGPHQHGSRNNLTQDYRIVNSGLCGVFRVLLRTWNRQEPVIIEVKSPCPTRQDYQGIIQSLHHCTPTLCNVVTLLNHYSFLLLYSENIMKYLE